MNYNKKIKQLQVKLKEILKEWKPIDKQRNDVLLDIEHFKQLRDGGRGLSSCCRSVQYKNGNEPDWRCHNCFRSID